MDSFFFELFLTAALSVLLAFLLGKIFSVDETDEPEIAAGDDRIGRGGDEKKVGDERIGDLGDDLDREVTEPSRGMPDIVVGEEERAEEKRVGPEMAFKGTHNEFDAKNEAGESSQVEKILGSEKLDVFVAENERRSSADGDEVMELPMISEEKHDESNIYKFDLKNEADEFSQEKEIRMEVQREVEEIVGSEKLNVRLVEKEKGLKKDNEEMELQKVNEKQGSAMVEVAVEKLTEPLEEGKKQGQECESQVEEEVMGGLIEKGSLLDEEDEWEGIERTDLEKLFGVANAFVGSGSGADALSRLSSDVQMQLYGLHKIATEGPCYEPQPSALKISARTKWHAWQRLGNMNPELAMEKYMALLSEKIPGWMQENATASHIHIKKHEDEKLIVGGIPGAGPPDAPLSSPSQLRFEAECKQEGSTCTEGYKATVAPEIFQSESESIKIDSSPICSPLPK